MANALYGKAKERMLNGTLNVAGGTVKALLVRSTYTPNFATHEFLPSIPAASRAGAALTLGSKTISGGVFDAADVTFPTISGTAVNAVVLYVEGNTEAASYLLAYIDTATGLPAVPNGGDIAVQWANTANRIFAL